MRPPQLKVVHDISTACTRSSDKTTKVLDYNSYRKLSLTEKSKSSNSSY